MNSHSQSYTSRKAKAEADLKVGNAWRILSMPIAVGAKTTLFTNSILGAAIIGFAILFLGNKMIVSAQKELDDIESQKQLDKNIT